MINILLNLYNFHKDWCFDTLKDIINQNYRVLIVPFSFHDNWMSNDEQWQTAYNRIYGNYYKDIVTPFLTYGIKEDNIFWLNYFSDTKNSAKSKILDSDIIFFTGGLPDKMMERLIEFDLVSTIESYKGIIIGCSAGAMIQISNYHITPDKDYSHFSYNKGLDIVKDFSIEVHYKNTVLQNKSIEKVLNSGVNKVYAMADCGGILIKDNRVTILGDVTLYSR